MPRYRYSIEVYPDEASASGWSIGLDKPDFQPAVEWIQFEALRAGHLPTSGTCVVEPVLVDGGPTFSEIKIEVPIGDGATFSGAIPFTYFSSVARRYRAALVKTGKLADGEPCSWAMAAWRSEEREGIESERQVAELLVKVEADSVEALLSRAKLSGPDNGSNFFKVFVPQDVLDETASMAKAAAPLECGGVLVGRLARDAASGELVEIVSAFVPALRAAASETELRFTPEAWNSVRAAVKLRARNEIWAGWFHSHTPLSWQDKCGRCPAEKQRSCSLATNFFSEQDRNLHRLFPAFGIGLVANVLADGVVHSCFGWRLGTIESRPFYILENAL